MLPPYSSERAFTEAIDLLKSLIECPSLSRQEADTADLLYDFLAQRLPQVKRHLNNVYAYARNWQTGRPTILLNSHHDTVKAAAGYTRNPHQPDVEGGRLYGLGSNDAGGALVALIATFLRLENDPTLNCNLILAATAEEEISGPNGVAALLPQLGQIDAAIVGEPTLLQLAIAERGLVVIDGEAQGKSGHAARQEGINALYLALEDIQTIRQFSFDRASTLLGPTRANVTQITAGTQHNVVPDRCTFVIDLRVNEQYTNEEAVALLQDQVNSILTARSYRLQSSSIALDHPLVQAGIAITQSTPYGSPTLSDQALMPFPTLKLGPGDSARSHTADEWIGIEEIQRGIDVYCQLLLAAY
ncbi:MAG: M20 family metallo-hydrolase [Bacteroidota bacterium]